MNTLFSFALACLISLQPLTTQTSVEVTTSPKTSSVEVIAIKAFDAYCKKDINTFAGLFAENAEVTMFPDKTLMKGRAEIEKNYASFFANTPDLQAELVSRQIKDNRVIDEMFVTRVKGRKADKVSVLYEIENGFIVKMCFL